MYDVEQVNTEESLVRDFLVWCIKTSKDEDLDLIYWED